MPFSHGKTREPTAMLAAQKGFHFPGDTLVYYRGGPIPEDLKNRSPYHPVDPVGPQHVFYRDEVGVTYRVLFNPWPGEVCFVEELKEVPFDAIYVVISMKPRELCYGIQFPWGSAWFSRTLPIGVRVAHVK